MSGREGLRVEARDVVRRFARRGGDTVTALDGVSVSIEPGSSVALRGRSGSGKTTLLSLLGGLDRPSAGTILIDGVDVATRSRAERVRLLRSVGFVLQGAPMIRRMPVWENVAAGLVPLGVPARDRAARARASLELVGLADGSDRAPERLSFGERQRVAVARALIHAPRLILADEPTSNLDRETAAIVAAALDSARAEGATVIVATHDERSFAAPSRSIRLEGGRRVGG